MEGSQQNRHNKNATHAPRRGGIAGFVRSRWLVAALPADATPLTTARDPGGGGWLVRREAKRFSRSLPAAAIATGHLYVPAPPRRAISLAALSQSRSPSRASAAAPTLRSARSCGATTTRDDNAAAGRPCG